MIKAGIIGGAGYTAGELTRILLHHPGAELIFTVSGSQKGLPVAQIHRDLTGDTDMVFSDHPYWDIDVLFLCSGHGKSQSWLEENKVPENICIIDLSSDFRITRHGNSFIYGLPELNREEITGNKHIANPGCFATTIQLALLPLAAKRLLSNDVHVHAITGSTGAGAIPGQTTHFSWRNSNVSIYKAFTHQHLEEINQSLKQLQSSFNKDLNFIPVRGNFTRGILASVYTKFEGTLSEAEEMYKSYYKDHPFVTVTGINPDLKMVVNTNKSVLYLEKHKDKLFIISILDNLLKGASGQAVQNMNLMFGLDETMGLKLKSTAF